MLNSISEVIQDIILLYILYNMDSQKKIIHGLAKETLKIAKYVFKKEPPE